MKKLWKKRLKRAFKKGDVASLFIGGTLVLGISTSLVTELIFSLILHFNWITVAEWSFGLSFLGIIIGFLCDILPENSPYDKEIEEDERRQLAKEKETRKKEQEKRQMEKMVQLNELKTMIMALNKKENHSNVASSFTNILTTLTTLLNKGSLEDKEEHYLTHTLPYHLKETLHIYQQLTEENQSQMASKIIHLVENKQNELENRFIHQHQKELLNHLEKRMELVQVEDY